MATEVRGLEALREKLGRPSPDDVVGTIFAYMEEDNFSSDRYLLQSFFHGLAEDPAYAELLSGFGFSTDTDLFPFSRILEAALGRLQMGLVIYAKNPSYLEYGMMADARERMMQRARRVFSPEQLQLLRTAGENLRTYSEDWTGEAEKRRLHSEVSPYSS